MNKLSNYNLKQVNLSNGQTLILRRAEADDAESLVNYLNIVGGESDNLLFGKNEFRLSIEQEEEYLNAVNNSSNNLMLLGILDNKIVSVAQISGNSRKRISHNSEISISVKKEYWNKGIGTIVLSELIKSAKENGTIKNISLGVKSSNHNAVKLYEKMGFVKVGIHKNFFNIDGVYYDEILMDLHI